MKSYSRARVRSMQSKYAAVFILFIFSSRFLFGMGADSADGLLSFDLDFHSERNDYSFTEGGHVEFKKNDLYGQLEEQKVNFEISHLERAFTHIDRLFEKTFIKIQEIMPDGNISSEKYSSLKEFLELPHDLKSIKRIIEADLRRELSEVELNRIKNHPPVNFPNAVRTLWQEKIINEKKAQELIIDHAPISSKELIRLIENGATKAKNDLLIQLKTGKSYGDVLKLFDSVSRTIHKIKSNNLLSPNFSITDLYKEPLAEEIAEALTNEGLSIEDVLSDARVIGELRRHFLFISSLGMPIRFRPGTVDFQPGAVPGSISPETTNYLRAAIKPSTLSAMLVGNHYINSLNASTKHGLYVNPLGISYAGTFYLEDSGADWWLSYTDGFLGGGANYTVNFDQGTAWSNGESSYLSIGAMAGGWKDYLIAGISLSTLLSNGIGIGASATMSFTESHSVTYLGEYPKDGKFSAIRGLHKIEIEDLKGVTATATFASNFSLVPLTTAFRASGTHTRRRIYRTHADLRKTQRMLGESDLSGLLLLAGKEVVETRIPSFDDPDILIDGDELIEIKIGKLSGAFVIGLETLIPIYASRIGGTIELSGEFELGIRRLPNDKFEVSIEPRRIYEMGLFAGVLNILTVGSIKSMAIARKQIFIFDFTRTEAKRAYFDLIHHGHLPTSEDIEVYSEDRGPEYLLTEFRTQNGTLAGRGIARTYLEKIRINTSKKHIGLQAPLVPAILTIVNKIDREARKSKERLNIRFEGIDREFVRSQAKSVATNGLISVRRNTFGGRRSEGQGFSGRYNQDLFVTHRRVHWIDETPFQWSGNKWQFDSLLVHAQLEDTVITGDQENQMADLINHLFTTFIGSFECKNSKSPRVISLEREFSTRDLDNLIKQESKDRISLASEITGIEQQKLIILLKKLKNKHPDHQGLIVKQFIETSKGLTGFAAIHQLLGAQPEHLYIRTESGYANAVTSAKRLVASYSNVSEIQTKTPSINLFPIVVHKNKKQVKNFYDESLLNLREIDNQLRLLHDDKYLLDDESLFCRIYGKEKMKELVSAGIRQDKTSHKTALASSRKIILALRDLRKQNFTDQERMIIYKMAGKKRMKLNELIDIYLFKNEPKKPNVTENFKKPFEKKLKKACELIKKIDKRLYKLTSDRVMNLMDKEYIDTSTKELKSLRSRIIKTLSLSLLNTSEKVNLKNQLDGKIECTHIWNEIF